MHDGVLDTRFCIGKTIQFRTITIKGIKIRVRCCSIVLEFNSNHYARSLVLILMSYIESILVAILRI